MRRYALLGWPIASSLSPALHQAAFRAAGVDATYTLWPSQRRDFDGRLEEARRGLDGFNLTQPLKRAILPHLAEVSEAARCCAGVNTVRVEGGRMVGHNTDLDGLSRSLAALSAAPGPVLILGSGGVVGAVLEALHRRGRSDIQLCARNRPAAEAWRARHPSRPDVLPWAGREAAAARAALLVQATPVGGDGPSPVTALPTDALLDLVVRPTGTTPIVAAAEARGLKALDGTMMLIEQAAEAQRFWGLPDEGVEALRAEYPARSRR